MKKKLLSLLLVLSMMLGMFAMMPISIGAADLQQDGGVYLIYTEDDWDTFAAMSDKNGTFKLMADLDFTGRSVSQVKNFTGTFDGNGKTISGITMHTGGEAGMFECSGGVKTVKNFVLTNSSFKGVQWVGAIFCDTVANTTIENVYITDTVSVHADGKNSTVTAYVGGFVGGCASGSTTLTIKNCVFAGTVTSGGQYTGGFVGSGNSTSGKIHCIQIDNCLMMGSVSTAATKSTRTSGFVGFNYQKDDATLQNSITNSIFAGTVTNAYSTFADEGNLTVTNCYATKCENGVYWCDDYNGGNKKTPDDANVTEVKTVKLIGEVSSDIMSNLPGWTTREDDIIVPTGVAGFNLPQSKYYGANAWDGEAADGFGGGSGSAADPYLITNESEWAYFASQCEDGDDFSGKYIKLMVDLTFNKGDATTWGETAPANKLIPVGLDAGDDKMFAGNFDGNGKTISGVYMNGYNSDEEADGIGLFGCSNGATIKNFVLKNSYFIAQDWAGCILGEAYVKTGNSNTTTIENVYICEDVTIKSTQSDSSKSSALGGFLGGMHGGDVTVRISDCVFAGTVTATTTAVGGFVGNGNYKTIVLEDCVMLGSVTGAGNASGFVGTNNKKSDNSVAGTTTLMNCIYAGSDYNNYPFGSFSPNTIDGKTYFTIQNCYTITANNSNAYSNGSGVKPSAENSGVSSVTLKKLVGTEATVTIEGWTKRDGDVMVPNGVASFDLPQWYVPPVLRGEGTSTTPYLIADASEWLTFVDMAKEKDFAGQYVVLESDIDFKNVTVAPVEGFAGTFDGKFYTIKNLTMSGSGDIGLFCSLGDNATIKNMVIKASSFTAKDNWIAPVACCTNGKNVIISNIYVDRDVTITSKKSDTSYAAGILGGVYGTNAIVTVDNCVFAGTVVASGMYAAGIVGCAESGNTTTVSNCMNIGTINGSNDYVAGIAVGAGLTVENCVSVGKVCGDKYVGGIYAGNPKSDVALVNCYTYGKLESHNTEGGANVTATNSAGFASLSALVGNNATVPSTFAKRAGDFAVPAALDAYIPAILTMQMYSGAAVRFDNPTGIRFSAILSNEYLKELKGDGEATFGIIIAPTDYVEAVGEFTIAALNTLELEYAYVIIPAQQIYSGGEADGYYEFRCALGDLNDYNYDRNFSAIAYVEVDGVYYYSAYNAEDNSRSIAYVAQKAYEDTNYEQNSAYPNEIAGQAGVYSPYTAAQRALLPKFFNQETLDLHFLSYNVRNVEDTSGWLDRPTYEYTDREIYLRDYLVNYGADIIGLQEAASLKATLGTLDWFETLGDEDTLVGLTAAGYTCVKGADVYAAGYTSEKTMYNPIYFKTDKFELIASGSKWFTSTPDVASRIDGANTYKNLNYVVLEHETTHQRFIYVNLHLIVQGDNNFVHDGDGNDTEFKVQQLQVIYLRSILQNLQDEYDLPMFVGGDFNNSYSTINGWFKGSVIGESGNQWDITSGTPEEAVKLSTARDAAVSKSPVIASCLGSGKFETDDITVGSKIDLWYTSNMNGFVHVYQIIDNKTTTTTGEKYPSDHLPAKLYVTLYLN